MESIATNLISLKNFKSSLPKEILKLAAKNPVRECDETGKGEFVAYVDDGDDSFDVSLKLNEKTELVNHSCDCKHHKLFCSHKAALLLHIATGKKVAYKIKAKKKTMAETLLDETGFEELKIWVSELINKNKEIELSFTHHFAKNKTQYTVEDIFKLTTDAMKAVVKNKRKIDPSELKKIVSLLEDVHAPIVKTYLAGVTDETAFNNFHSVIESCIHLSHQLTINSNKLSTYIDGIIKKSADIIYNLATDEAWTTATGFYLNLFYQKELLRLHYVMHISNILSISTGDRKTGLAKRIVEQYKTDIKVNPDISSNYTTIVFHLAASNNLLPQYLKLFKPIPYQNDYNISLIGQLVSANELALAEKYCHQQIASNYRDEYNIPYLHFLKKIYKANEAITNLVPVMEKLLPAEWDFDDFIFLLDRIPEEEKKKQWRTKLLSRASNAARNYHTGAASFIFKLMDHEKKYKKMIDYISSFTSFHYFLPYFTKMALTDKNLLMEAMLKKNDDYGWHSNTKNREIDKECMPQFVALTIQHFDEAYIIKAVKNAMNKHYFYNTNLYTKALIEHFNINK